MSLDSEMVWTEKYRPRKLDDIVGHGPIVSRLKQFALNRNMPHCLFVGPPGVGKTTAALCLAHEMLGEYFSSGYLELNASDDRGIDVVREQVKDYARTVSFGDVPFKILVLDECDSMTGEAQHALRRTMELYTDRCRFILIGNYANRIIEPIQSRCAIFRFTRLSEQEVVKRLEYICKREKVEYTAEGLGALFESGGGDLRMCINALQSLAVLGKKVDRAGVAEVMGAAIGSDVSQLISLAMGGRFDDARKKLQEVLYTNAAAPSDVVKQIYREVVRSAYPDSVKAGVLSYLGDTEYRLMQGADGEVQLDALLAKIVVLSKGVE